MVATPSILLGAMGGKTIHGGLSHIHMCNEIVKFTTKEKNYHALEISSSSKDLIIPTLTNGHIMLYKPIEIVIH